MDRRTSVRVSIVVTVILVAGTTIIGPVSGAGQITAETEYSGTESDTQRVNVTLRVTADDITRNVTVNVQQINTAFVDFRSFETTKPAVDDIQVINEGRGEYRITRLKPGQEVNIQFSVYPRTIKEESLTVARYTISSDQNPDSQTNEITANMSSSSWFALQDALDRENELSSEIQSLERRIRTQRLSFYGGLAVGVLGLVAAGFTYYRRDQAVENVQRDAIYELKSLEQSLPDGSDPQFEVRDTRRSLEKMWDDGDGDGIEEEPKPGREEDFDGTGGSGDSFGETGGSDSGFGEEGSDDEGFGD